MGRLSEDAARIDHVFVSREAGDLVMMARHRKVHERVRALLGAEFHGALLRVLAPELLVSPEQAIAVWSRMLSHKRNLEHQLGRRVGVAVASLDYLHQTLGALHHPVLLSHEGHAALIRHSSLDNKTGVLNHGAFVATLARELSRAERYHQPLSLLLIDVDGFKRVNDRCGHLGGDGVLRRLADTLRTAMRAGDVCARYGGDEFAVVATQTRESHAGELARRLCDLVESALAAESMTLSVGVAAWAERGQTLAELIEAADAALFASKRAGGNHVTLAGELCKSDRQLA